MADFNQQTPWWTRFLTPVGIVMLIVMVPCIGVLVALALPLFNWFRR